MQVSVFRVGFGVAHYYIDRMSGEHTLRWTDLLEAQIRENVLGDTCDVAEADAPLYRVRDDVLNELVSREAAEGALSRILPRA